MTRRPELRDHQRDLYYFRLRLTIAGSTLLFLFLLLLTRFTYLQIFQHEHYQTLAEQNRISIVPIAPNRGLILDRNGVPLAHNYTAFTLEITPSKAGHLEQTIDALGTLIEITPKDRKRFKKLLEESRNSESLPIRTRLNDVEIARFAANRYRFSGVDIKARLFRHYPQGEITSHAVGYIGRINDKDLEHLTANNNLANYRGTNHIGRAGLEQSYESELHGTTGFEEVETDAGGRAVRTLSRTPPTSGNNLTLHLDLKLQQVAEQVFGDFRGAVIAIEPKSGGVLAYLSKPGFDTNLFVDGIDTQSWELLNNSPDKPLVNRTMHGQYPPGSTIKPFMALAGLELNKRTPSFGINDPGFFTLPGSSHRYRDWKVGGHGFVDMHKSIVISCDTYYYGLAVDMGIDNIFSFLSHFGFGKKTGIDIEGERSGLLPSQAWKMKHFKQKWFVGDTVSVGIGQGYNLATPLQLAVATATMANQGTQMQPQLVRHIQNSKSGVIVPRTPQAVSTLPIKPENLELVIKAMIDVSRPGGTAGRAFAGAPYAIAGKTGTSQVIAIKQGEKYVASRVAERHRDHALFVAYAPAEDPKIALAILVENGGHGGATAAPMARALFDYYLLGKLPARPATFEVEGDEHD